MRTLPSAATPPAQPARPARGAAAGTFVSLDARGGEVVLAGDPVGCVGDPESMDGQGIHVAWRWDGERLTVRTDRFGLCPAFVWERPGGVTISPRLDVLLAQGAPRELDVPAIGIFLRLGYYIDDDTPFRHIRALPPGCDAEWTRDRGWVVRQGGWPIVPPVRRTRAQLVAEYGERFEEAVRSCITPGRRIIHPLSGGLDSRHLLFALRAAGTLPDLAVTFGAWEAPVAAQVAAFVGVPHHVVHLPATVHDNELEKNRATWWLSDEHAGLTFLGRALDELDPQREALVFDGLGGGVLSDGKFATPERARLAAAGEWGRAARDIMRSDMADVLHPDVRAAARYDHAVERLAESLRAHAAAANPVISWVLANRTRREIALSPFVLLGPERARTPWFAPAVYDFLASIPPDELLETKLHAETLARAYPDAARLPFYSAARQAPARGIAALRAHRGEIGFARALVAELSRDGSRLLSRGNVALRLLAGIVTERRRPNLRHLCNMVLVLYDLDRSNREQALPAPAGVADSAVSSRPVRT